MFKTKIELEKLNQMAANNMNGHLGIEFVDFGEDFIVAKMPVDHRTHQPFGLLHGGASVVLAETLGSVASWLCLEDPKNQSSVGLEINANHLRSVFSGFVYGKVTPMHVGKTTQVWQIIISDEAGNKVCVSRITVMTVNKK